MTDNKFQGLPRALKLAFVGLVLGLLLTWFSYIFVFSNSNVHDAAYPIFGRGFKTIAYLIGTIRMSLVEIVLLSMGAVLVSCSFIVFWLHTRNTERGSDILGLFSGIVFLLLSLPILQFWGPVPDAQSPPVGPVAVSLILSIAGSIIVVIYMWKTELFLRDKIIQSRVRLSIYIITSLGVFTGSSFFVLGSSAFLYFGNFNVGRGILILSPCLFLLASIIGAIAYARDREELLDMENSREERKSRKIQNLQDNRSMV